MPDNPMNVPAKGFTALRRGRWSTTGADYFLTMCAQRPANCLNREPILTAAFKELRRWDDEGHWQTRTAVFMPDHLHLLVTLGANTGLSAAVRLFKGRLTPILRSTPAKWQQSFYDHRLRKNEDTLPVFLYVFLNPYRAGLCSAEQTWAGFYCCPVNWAWFSTMISESCAEPAWLL